jgi:hypothetical protein
MNSRFSCMIKYLKTDLGIPAALCWGRIERYLWEHLNDLIKVRAEDRLQ